VELQQYYFRFLSNISLVIISG